MFSGDLPVARAERWALVDSILARWFGPTKGAAGFDETVLDAAERRLGLRLPQALREWYARTGARADVWSPQDELIPPSAIVVEDGVLRLAVENQGVVSWGIQVDALGSDDPAVVVSDPAGGSGWFAHSPTVSAFALQFAALNAKWSDAVRCRASGEGTAAGFDAIARAYRRIPLPDSRWPAHPTRFYGDDEIVLEDDAGTWLWVTARTQTAFAAFEALALETGMDEWESFEGGRS